MDSRQEAHRPGKATMYEKALIDVDGRIYVENWRVSSEEIYIGDGSKWRIEKLRLRGGRADGVDIVEVDNGRLSFIVVPTRGMGIWKGKFDGCFLGWNSPVKGLVHPHYVNLEDRGGLGWLSGFNEWMVRCGLESNGTPGEDVIIDNMGDEKRVMLPLHGRIANTPASEVKAYVGLESPFELGVKGVVHEQAMFGTNLKLSTTISTAIGSNWIRISDTIENMRSIPDEMQVLYHWNYGPPLLEKGARLVAPVQRVAPRDRRAAEGMEELSYFGPPEPGFVEQAYFFELASNGNHRTRVMLTNRSETKAASLSFSLKELPYFTLWKNTTSLEDGYVTGLEPATNFPNQRRFERKHGRVVNLGPREKYAAEVTLAVHLGRREVQNIKSEIERLQGQVKPEIFGKPIPEFSQRAG